ncbi:MAG: 50S ribosomal protein L11 methyltransferase [Neomegalonema sp.]|nr:50S ribosomal protein L11 methyltransferase [Neomegalonema sp.]
MNGLCYVALTTLPGEAPAQALGERIEEAMAPTGVGVFEVEDGSGLWEVGAYFDAQPDETALALLAAVAGAKPFAVSEVGGHDWVAQVKRELTPVPAGRFIVHGSHDRETIPPNAIGLEIEAAMAFGTGHHGTTAGCLIALDRLLRRKVPLSRVADVGCGTGVLAMAAAAARPRAFVAATDIDAIAAQATAANAAANRLRGRVRSGCAPGLSWPQMAKGAPYDLIFANILARPLKRLAPSIAASVRPGGRVILSGLLLRQMSDVMGMYRAWGFAPEHIVKREGWATLTLRRARR